MLWVFILIFWIGGMLFIMLKSMQYPNSNNAANKGAVAVINQIELPPLAPGRIFLLVTGIVYIVIGVVAVLSGVALDTMRQTINSTGSLFGISGAGNTLGGLGFITVISGSYYIIIGILAIVYRNSYIKSGLLMVLGIVAIVYDLISIFVSIILDVFVPSSIVFLAIPIF